MCHLVTSQHTNHWYTCPAYLRGTHSANIYLYTVNIYIFAQYIFSRILHSALDARKYDVNEKMKHYRSNRIYYKMRENLSTRKCHQGLDVRKFRCAKISTFTVYKYIWYRYICSMHLKSRSKVAGKCV